MNEGGKYSLEKFREAQNAAREGDPDREKISDEEWEFLKRHRQISRDIALKYSPNFVYPTGFAIAGQMFLDLVEKDRRFVLLNGGKARRTEEKYYNTVEGQVDAAQKEAEVINRKYDWHVKNIREAMRSFERFKQGLGHDPRLSEEAHRERIESMKMSDDPWQILAHEVVAMNSEFGKGLLGPQQRKIVMEALDYVKFDILPTLTDEQQRSIVQGEGGPRARIKKEMFDYILRTMPSLEGRKAEVRSWVGLKAEGGL